MSRKKDFLKKLAKQKSKEKKKRQHSKETENDLYFCGDNQSVGEQVVAMETAEEVAPLLELDDNAEISKQKRKLHKKKKAKDKYNEYTDNQQRKAPIDESTEDPMNNEQNELTYQPKNNEAKLSKKRKHHQTNDQLEHQEVTEKEDHQIKKKRKKKHHSKETDSDPNLCLEHNNNSDIIPKIKTPENSSFRALLRKLGDNSENNPWLNDNIINTKGNRRNHKKISETCIPVAPLMELGDNAEQYSSQKVTRKNQSNSNITEIIPESEIEQSVPLIEEDKSNTRRKGKKQKKKIDQTNNIIPETELVEQSEPIIGVDEKYESNTRRKGKKQKKKIDQTNNIIPETELVEQSEPIIGVDEKYESNTRRKGKKQKKKIDQTNNIIPETELVEQSEPIIEVDEKDESITKRKDKKQKKKIDQTNNIIPETELVEQSEPIIEVDEEDKSNTRRKDKKQKKKIDQTNNIIPETELVEQSEPIIEVDEKDESNTRRKNKKQKKKVDHSNNVREIIPETEIVEQTEPIIEVDEEDKSNTRRKDKKQKKKVDQSNNNSREILPDAKTSEQSELLTELRYEIRNKDKDSDNFSSDGTSDDTVTQNTGIRHKSRHQNYREKIKKDPVRRAHYFAIKRAWLERKKKEREIELKELEMRLTLILEGKIIADDPIIQEKVLAKSKQYFEILSSQTMSDRRRIRLLLEVKNLMNPSERIIQRENYKQRMIQIIEGTIVEDDPIKQEQNLAEAKAYFIKHTRLTRSLIGTEDNQLSMKLRTLVAQLDNVPRLMKKLIERTNTVSSEELQKKREELQKKREELQKKHEELQKKREELLKKREESRIKSKERFNEYCKEYHKKKRLIKMTAIMEGKLVSDNPRQQKLNLTIAKRFFEKLKRGNDNTAKLLTQNNSLSKTVTGTSQPRLVSELTKNTVNARRGIKNLQASNVSRQRKKPSESSGLSTSGEIGSLQVVNTLNESRDTIISSNRRNTMNRNGESDNLQMANASNVSRQRSQSYERRITMNQNEDIENLQVANPGNNFRETNAPSVRRKAKNTIADFTIDSTESIQTLLDHFEQKNRSLYAIYCRLLSKVPDEGKNEAPHFLLPGLPLNSFADDFDGSLPSRYYEKFAYKCTMPTITTRLKNLEFKDQVTETMRVKSEWKSDVYFAVKGANASKDLENTEKRNDQVYTCPEKLVWLAVLLEQDPDPHFCDAYNWYFAGNGNLHVLSVNDADCLLHSQLSRLYLSKFSRRKLITKNRPLASFDCGNGNIIFETICNINNYVVIRLKHKIYILKLTTEKNILKFLNFNEIDSKIPFTSIEFDNYQKNILYITKLDGTLSIVNLDMMKSRTLELMTGKSMVNNWNKVITVDQKSYCHVTKDGLKIYDKKTNSIVYELTDFKENYSERDCDGITAVKKCEDVPFAFIATSHLMFLMDLRWQNNHRPRLLRRWTHQMKNVPTYISQIKHELNKDLICLSSQWPEDTTLISNDIDIYNDVSISGSVTLPYGLPTFATTLDAAKSKMLCVNIYHPLEQRLYTSLTGNCVMAADEDVIVLTLNSLGDIFAYTLFPEHLDREDDSLERLHEWGSTMTKEKTVYESSEVIDISYVWKSLRVVPSDFVIGDERLSRGRSKFDEQAVHNICESGAIDAALLDAWQDEEKDDTKVEETALNIDLHFSDSE